MLHSRDSLQAVHTHSHTILTQHYSHSRRSYSQLFSHYSHSRTLFARPHTIRTLFARSHTVRTLFARSHTIRTLFAIFARCYLPVYIIHSSFARFTHDSRHRHTIFAHYSHQFTHPVGHTIRAASGGASPFALIHAVFTQFTPVRICECAIGTL